MEQIEQFRATFFQECDELFGKLELHLTALAEDYSDAEQLHAAFRAIHSIKGGAGMFGFSRLVAFAHKFENVLDLMRSGRLDVTAGLIEKALNASDMLANLVHATRNGDQLGDGYEVHVADDLMALCRQSGSTRTAASTPSPVTAQLASSVEERLSSENAIGFRISFDPAPDLLRRAIDPLRMVRNLEELGKVSVCANTSRLPSLASLDPTLLYLSWDIEVETSSNLSAVQQVFEFVEGSSKLEFVALSKAVDVMPSSEAASTGAPAEHEPATAEQPAPCPAATSASSQQTAQSQRISSIRVDLDRVDRLVNLVGEIAISQAMVLQQIDQTLIDSNPRLFRDLSQLLQHSRSLQDSVMAIRAQPVRSIFARMPRVVRELAQQTGKKVYLEMSGESTEIDKTIVEELSDPLVHIIRNAIGHGVELPEERTAKGKPVTGTIRLIASQRGSRIIIEVSDDGRGIDRDKVLRTAIDNNLISADAELTDEEIDNLIFLPGLSTADRISDISGRGVGMDVVYRNIQRLGGRVTLRSQPGRGTTTTLTLPLTLAVLDGMTVKARSESYLIPLANIVECLITNECEVRTIPGSGEVVNMRGRQVRVIRLADALSGSRTANAGQLRIVIVEVESGTSIGLVVDEIVGQQQVVIKSVRENVGDIPGIAGGTILGDGSVALILDVTALFEMSAARDFGRFRAEALCRKFERNVA